MQCKFENKKENQSSASGFRVHVLFENLISRLLGKLSEDDEFVKTPNSFPFGTRILVMQSRRIKMKNLESQF